MSSPKRRRLSLSTSSRHHGDRQGQARLLGQAILEQNHLTAHNQLEKLHSGKLSHGEIAWSRNNLIAHSSSTSISPGSLDSPHVVLKSLCNLHTKRNRTDFQPCHLYPPADFPASGSLSSLPSTSTHPGYYGDPEFLTFSHCGYYLAAFFPLLNSSTSTLSEKTTLMEQQTKALKQIEQAASGPSTNEVSILSRLPTATAGEAGGLATTVDATPLIPSVPTPPLKPSPAGKLCIWTRADTGALNDWSLLQSIPVRQGSGARSGGPSKTENILKVNSQGEQVTSDSLRLDDGKDHANSTKILQGGIVHISWLSPKRKWVFRSSGSSSSIFEREACRGPTFLDSELQDGPQQNQAFLVFGKQGQVSLLYLRPGDQSEANPNPLVSGGPMAPPVDLSVHNQFKILHSSLYVPDLQPAPPILDSDMADPPSNLVDAVSAGVTSFPRQGSEISHLAVGLMTKESAIFVASKRSLETDDHIHVTEILIDLKAETVSLITRPILSLPSADTRSDPLEPLEAPDKLMNQDRATLSCLAWVGPVDRDTGGPNKAEAATPFTASLPSSPFRLVATFTMSSISEQDGCKTLKGSMIKVWDVVQEKNELSEAFSTLECRKAGQPRQWLDWYLRANCAKLYDGCMFTSLTPPGSSLAHPNVVLASVLSKQAGKTESEHKYTETTKYLDVATFEMLPTSHSESMIPPSALARRSAAALSPNGVLFAALAPSPPGSWKRKVTLWRVPRISSDNLDHNTDAETKAGRLAALASLRKNDMQDVARVVWTENVASPKHVGSIVKAAAEALGVYSNKATCEPNGTGDLLQQQQSATQTPTFVQILKLLELHLSLLRGVKSEGEMQKARAPRLIHELSLSFQLLKHSRKKAMVRDDKNRLRPARERVYYRLDSVWTILAQLQWLLNVLDSIGRLAVLPESERKTEQELEIVRLFTFTSPRRLLLQTLKGMCEFKDWLLSTVKKQNLPPLPSTLDGAYSSSSSDNSCMALAGASFDPRIFAVSDQLELARDALGHVIVGSSVDLEDITRVFAELDKSFSASQPLTATVASKAEEDEHVWWSDLVSTDDDQERRDQGKKLLKSIVDVESGALVDCLTLFIGPSDLLDERTVLSTTASDAAALVNTDVKQQERDIIRKTFLKNPITLSTPVLGVNGTAMRKKRCLRCFSVSQDPVVISSQFTEQQQRFSTSADRMMNSNSDQLQPAFGVAMIPTTTVRSQSVSALEEKFRYHCICGGNWWLL